jgi:hypothetical protein
VTAFDPIAKNIRRIAHLDIPGGGQVIVRDGLALIGHIEPPYGTSILDVSDPANPRLLSQIMLEGNASHSHKARFAGDRDLIVVNREMHDRDFLRKGFALAEESAAFKARKGRDPTDAELATLLRAPVERLDELRAVAARGYDEGGIRLYDISDPANPVPAGDRRTGGIGVHRFDCDAPYAYISTEMEGYVGNIIVIYDIADPANVTEVSRWHMPGQHVATGETPDWQGVQNRVHHGLRVGDELWTSCWHAGFRVIDLSDIAAPKTVAAHNYHPPFPEPTHTVMPLPGLHGGRRVAVCVDEEHPHATGQPHAFLWLFDVTGFDAPWARAHLNENGVYAHVQPEIYGPGAHQFQEHCRDGLIYCTWFSAGLRVIDVCNPLRPTERGYFVPPPAPGFPAPQSNDVDVDDDGVIYLLDRVNGLDILTLDN